jgi:CheY-like chemotaxis protein
VNNHPSLRINRVWSGRRADQTTKPFGEHDVTAKSDADGKKWMLTENVVRLVTVSPADQPPYVNRASRFEFANHHRRSTTWPKTNAGIRRILIVDGDPGILKVVVKMAQYLGYRATAVLSAADALQALHKTRYAVVIAEYDLPCMRASQLAERIKTKHAGTQVIIMTGRCQAEISGRLGGVGLVNGLLFKPFNLDTMREQIEMSHRPCSRYHSTSSLC